MRIALTTPSWYQALSTREQRLVLASSTALLLYLLYLIVSPLFDAGNSSDLQITRLKQQQREIAILARKYNTLKAKRDSLQEVFIRSQLSFEQVSQELDKIIRSSIGSDNYDLKRSSSTVEFGLGFKRQDFLISVKNLNQNQLVSLLSQLERREKPIFLTKADLTKNTGAETSISASLEVFTIGK
jgi:hypothetical protein